MVLCIVFIGWFDDVWVLFLIIDVLFVLLYYESLLYVCCEVMLFGCLVIVMCVGGLFENVELGVDGWVVLLCEFVVIEVILCVIV